MKISIPRRIAARTAALAAIVVGLPVSTALADPPAACWTAEALAGMASEKASHKPTAAERVEVPADPLSPTASSPAPYAGVVRRVRLSSAQKLVALTFDLCEARGEVSGYDGEIVDTLRALKAPATFFMGGRWAQSHETRAMQLLADPLFEIGDHTYDHANLDHADAAKVRTEIDRTETVLNGLRDRVARMCPAASLHPSRLFRFPYGSCSPENFSAVASLGETPVQWDVVSGDPGGIAAGPMSKIVVAEVKPGSIVVMHANGRGTHTGEALKTIIPALRAKGYRFVTVDELIAAGSPQTAALCYVERPGDTARYDKKPAAKLSPVAQPGKAQPAGGKGVGVPAPSAG